MQNKIAKEIIESSLSPLLTKFEVYISFDIASDKKQIYISSKIILPDEEINNLKKGFSEKIGLEVIITPVANRLSIQPGAKSIEGIKNIIAVGSAKGGVGKSTTTLNLAYHFAKSGFKVGILDADIYGPSMPLMMGAELANNSPEVDESGCMMPQEKYGIKMISMGHLVDEATPVVWRGPMVSNALMQLLEKTAWGSIDYLFVDLPPGTGDILLSLCQKVPIAGVVLVTTPEAVAWRDTLKSASMFKKMNIDLLGLVENMSKFTCPNCEHEFDLFGSGGADVLAEIFDISVIGRVRYDNNVLNSHLSNTEDFARSAFTLSTLLSEKSLSRSAPISNVKIT